MPKRPVSVTLDEGNLLWLRGRMARLKRRSLSDAIDEIVTAARTSGTIEPGRSVVGTIDVNVDDPGLEHADAFVRSLLAQSLGRALAVHEDADVYGATPPRPRARPANARGRRGGA